MNTTKEKFIAEPERYEFSALPIHQFELQRRDFFKILGAGIAVFLVAKDALAAQETAPGSRSFHNEEPPKEITSWLHVGEDGTVTIAKQAGEKLNVIQTLKTVVGARTMALDPVTHKIYLPAPTPAFRVLVYGIE